MQFVHPYFLFGLAAVALPVIVHLFNFRKFKRVFFTNVRFIKDIQLETRRQSRLKHLIVLALRILAIICLVFTFAQPFIPLTSLSLQSAQGSYISIYTDNSFSMEAHNDEGTLLETARKKAGEIAAAFGAGDKFQLLTNDFEGLHQRFVQREEFQELLAGIRISPSSRKLSDVVKRQQDLMKNDGGRTKNLYLISDFQKSITDFTNFPKDTSLHYFLVPLKAHPAANISVDSCWFSSPVHQSGKKVKLFVLVKNHAPQACENIPLKVLVNGNQKAATSFSLPPLSEATLEISYQEAGPGQHFGTIEIADNPIIYDDTFFFTYTVSADIPVLVIDQGTPNIYLSALLKNDSSFRYQRQSYNNLDVSAFGRFHFIILDGLPVVSSGLVQELQRFVSKGGSLLINPPVRMEGESYQRFLMALQAPQYGPLSRRAQRVNDLALGHPMFQDVFDHLPEKMDLPAVFTWYPIRSGVSGHHEWLMRMQDNQTFLGVSRSGDGRIYQLASPLGPTGSTFQQHALFVPVLYKMALLSQPNPRLWYTLGADEKIPYPLGSGDGDQVIKIRQHKGKAEFIPEVNGRDGASGLFVHQQIREAGHFEVIGPQENHSGLAFNYARTESRQDTYTAEELKEQCDRAGLQNVSLVDQPDRNLTEVIRDLYSGIKLWKLFIILALLFLAAEVCILRFWK